MYSLRIYRSLVRLSAESAELIHFFLEFFTLLVTSLFRAVSKVAKMEVLEEDRHVGRESAFPSYNPKYQGGTLFSSRLQSSGYQQRRHGCREKLVHWCSLYHWVLLDVDQIGCQCQLEVLQYGCFNYQLMRLNFICWISPQKSYFLQCWFSNRWIKYYSGRQQYFEEANDSLVS